MSIPEVFPRTPTTAEMGPKARALLATISEYDDFYGILLDVLAEARAPLDVGLLAKAMRAEDIAFEADFRNGQKAWTWERHAEALAREYAALEEPTP